MIVQTQGLHKSFGRHAVLRGLSLSVPEGSAYALIGANGAGKTTTIKVLMNLLDPSGGSATVLGVDSRRLAARELAQIGYVAESQEMPRRLTVGRYLDYLRPFYAAWDRTLESSLVRELELPRERRIGDLSHGMRLKMALACALPFAPRLLVLDEPFSGLDALVRDEFMEGLLRRAGETTIFISSHELSEIEGVVTHVGFIDRGTLLLEDSMEELSRRVREVRITLPGVARVPVGLPASWVQPALSGNVLTFTDLRFEAVRFADAVAALFAGVRNIDVRPVALRSLFTTLAKSAREGDLAS